MHLIAHHMALEVFGREFAPETMAEHVAAFAVLGAVLALMAYGAYAAARDLRRWRGRGK